MRYIPHRSRVSHTSFRKLPIGAAYYIASDGTGPFVKLGGHTKLSANSMPQTTPTQTAIADNRIDTIRVDRFFRREQS